ncbi:MAG TPA: HipA domain-containing protein [Verrucomicrobiae bacterium]|nr:HipA domain-containing protein [Verrucomicrobiae bacterium]
MFWLIGAADGHTRNFSLFLRPQGRFYMTPDVLSAPPSLDNRQIEREQMKPAMSVGTSRHYKSTEMNSALLSAYISEISYARDKWPMHIQPA